MLHALGYGRLQRVWRTVRETLFTTGAAWGFSAVLFLIELLYLQYSVFKSLGLRPAFATLPPGCSPCRCRSRCSLPPRVRPRGHCPNSIPCPSSRGVTRVRDTPDDARYLMAHCGVRLKAGRMFEPRTNEIVLLEEVVRALGLGSTDLNLRPGMNAKVQIVTR